MLIPNVRYSFVIRNLPYRLSTCIATRTDHSRNACASRRHQTTRPDEHGVGIWRSLESPARFMRCLRRLPSKLHRILTTTTNLLIAGNAFSPRRPRRKGPSSAAAHSRPISDRATAETRTWQVKTPDASLRRFGPRYFRKFWVEKTDEHLSARQVSVHWFTKRCQSVPAEVGVPKNWSLQKRTDARLKNAEKSKNNRCYSEVGRAFKN